jgi:hypothetical protein
MATRKVFIDSAGHKITPYLESDKTLAIEVQTGDDPKIFIQLSKEDSEEFIMDLYRLKKQIPK